MKVKNEVSAGGIVYKKTKEKIEWLICQHSQHKGWVFPKGLIGDSVANEPMEQAALRETEEEGGVKAKIVNHTPVRVSYMYRFKDTLIRKTVFYFLMEYVSGDPKNHDWEMADAKFVPKKDVVKTLTYSSDKEAFEKIVQLL